MLHAKKESDSLHPDVDSRAPAGSNTRHVSCSSGGAAHRIFLPQPYLSPSKRSNHSYFHPVRLTPAFLHPLSGSHRGELLPQLRSLRPLPDHRRARSIPCNEATDVCCNEVRRCYEPRNFICSCHRAPAPLLLMHSRLLEA